MTTGEYNPAPTLIELSADQQNLAARLGDGYRVIRGVAGSGKTVVLLERLKLLSERNPTSEFLLVCYNRALCDALKLRLSAYPRVTVATIDSVATDECRRRKIVVDSNGPDHFQAKVDAAANAARSNDGAAKRYDAVFVDEAQDFDHQRLDLAFFTLREPDCDFVVVYDAAQDIYRQGAGRWMPPGKTARGRTTLLRLNYRNTMEVLQHAYYFLIRGRPEVSNEPEPANPEAIAHPLSARTGPPPRTLLLDSAETAAEVIISEIRDLISKGEQPNRIAILGGNRLARKQIFLAAKRHSVPFVDFSFGAWPVSSDESVNSVHCGSLQKLKGLEYKHVYLLGLDKIEVGDAAVDDALLRRLIYVGMTRSTHNLTVVLHGEGEMIHELREVDRILRA